MRSTASALPAGTQVNIPASAIVGPQTLNSWASIRFNRSLDSSRAYRASQQGLHQHRALFYPVDVLCSDCRTLHEQFAFHLDLEGCIERLKDSLLVCKAGKNDCRACHRIFDGFCNVRLANPFTQRGCSARGTVPQNQWLHEISLWHQVVAHNLQIVN